MKFGFVVLFVSAAVLLSGCYQTSGYAPQSYGMAHPSDPGVGYYNAQYRPSNHWVSHCKGGYDKCGRDGITQRQTGTIPY
jgi:hypothetical protein